MNRVVLRGCEAEYFGDFIRTTEICHKRETVSDPAGGDNGHPAPSLQVHQLEGETGDDISLPAPLPLPSLVMHVRSGDIFGQKVGISNYGQVSSGRS